MTAPETHELMNELSLDKTVLAVRDTVLREAPQLKGRYLDIGSGTGALIRLIRESLPDLESSVCDYSDRFMKIPGQKVDIIDLNDGHLPYDDNSFELVTFTEVAEHLENHRAILREIYRVLKPEGLLVITTPNILNIKSRLRFFLYGFWNFFGPMPVGHDSPESTMGHITPLSYFYLGHTLLETGFGRLKCGFDKYFARSIIPLILFYLPIRLYARMRVRWESRKHKSIDDSNIELIKPLNTWQMLLGRSIVVSARK
ncbi:MAG: class I SAM-dependent methyltransferase [Mariprofundaceae bacterium]|nr:class I SAM-dependent methyltransferase [Mariprofundaceae bacterium]